MNYISEWYKYLENKSFDKEKVSAVINKLTDNYNEVHRYYHNLNHIKNMYDSLSKFKGKIVNNESIFYAAWLHDIIYDTKSSDNEEKSSEFAENLLSELNINDMVIKKVIRLILITKNHHPIENSFDEKIFLDSDLLILGQSADKYDEYMKSIRKEFQWVDDVKYNTGRKKILKNFLQRETIYFTKEFGSLYESIARKNIQKEINSLR